MGVDPQKLPGGLVAPRLCSPDVGLESLAGEAIPWINASGVLGRMSLLPWQEYVLQRSLEVRDGRLRWRTVVVTVARQQGKSVLMRSLLWWRIHQAERFGEHQLAISTANIQATAREVWRPAALHAREVYGKQVSKFGRGTEETDLTEFVDGRWSVQAAGPNTAVGWSPSFAFVDEAWNVPRNVVDEAIVPAMSEREQPQLWLVSTAGDGKSDLLQSYREAALQDTDDEGDVLLLEWSAPPAAPYNDPVTWRWASPHWGERREAFLKSQIQAISEAAFKVQYLNQWVQSVDGWMPASIWANGETDLEPEGSPEAIAVEVSLDGQRFAAVSAYRVGEDQILVTSYVTKSSAMLWEHVEAQAPARLLLSPPLAVHYQGRIRPEVVGVTELSRHLIGVSRAAADRRLLHHATDHALNEDIARAVTAQSDTGMRLSERKSTGPIEACRAMVWAAGELLKPAAPRPSVQAV